MKRNQRSAIAQETLATLRVGYYDLPDGRRVEIAAMVEACLEKTRCFEPAELQRLRDITLATPPLTTSTTIEVRNETTLQAIARLHAAGIKAIAALNFASAKNPGGGFLNGSQAQEESLARSSALYSSLLRAPDYYQRHRAGKSNLYSHTMILSPWCPIIRNDAGEWLESPPQATFITSAAPNAGAVRASVREEQLPRVFRERAELVLALAHSQGCDHLVLGAWGCGVFRNDPEMVAGIFQEHLRGAWRNRFSHIVFSVFDSTDEQSILKAFEILRC